MMRGMIAGIMLALFCGVCLGQVSVEERAAAARAARGVGLGVNLLKWDSAQTEGGWKRWWSRNPQAPGFAVDWTKGSRGLPALLLSGSGRKNVFGGWQYTVKNIRPGKYYRFYATMDARGIVSPRREILCRIRWTGKDFGPEITPEYVTEYKRGAGYQLTFDQKFPAPEKATGAVVELFLQWAPGAILTFEKVALEGDRPAAARVVRVATVFWNAADGPTPAATLEALGALVEKAAAANADVILLPETITSIGSGLSPQEAAETPPGDVSSAIGKMAKKHQCHIIYGFHEKSPDGAVYNSAMIMDPKGAGAGIYRQVQVSSRDAEAGVSAGRYFKTFQLDFGKVGILISHDVAFAEAARVLMLDGAEMIFVPMQREDQKQIEARAVDNGVWVVSAGVKAPSTVVDPTGTVRAISFTGIGEGVALHMIDLAKKVRRPYAGDWRNRVIKERRTDAYLKIVQE